MYTVAVLTAALYLLNDTQRIIAKLAFATVNQTPNKDNEILMPVICVFAVVCELFGNITFAWGCLVYLICQYVANIWRTQTLFADLDRKTKSTTPSYISSVNPATQSGWANNPRVLERIPVILSTRVLTTMTLVEVSVLLFVASVFPAYTAHALIFTVLGHYITDALDGAVGRYRKEGYVLWGYYVDHCFDTLYECGCMLALWIVSDHTSYAGLVAILGMALTVYLFHTKELYMFEHKLATQYTNVLGSFPLHYIEWGSVAILILIIWFQVSWTPVTPVVASLTLSSAINLCWWFVTQLNKPSSKLDK